MIFNSLGCCSWFFRILWAELFSPEVFLWGTLTYEDALEPKPEPESLRDLRCFYECPVLMFSVLWMLDSDLSSCSSLTS